MNKPYLVRCTAAQGRAMAGIYVAALTASGMVATWKPGRARYFESADAAQSTARQLARRFSGTTWEVCHDA